MKATGFSRFRVHVNHLHLHSCTLSSPSTLTYREAAVDHAVRCDVFTVFGSDVFTVFDASHLQEVSEDSVQFQSMPQVPETAGRDESTPSSHPLPEDQDREMGLRILALYLLRPPLSLPSMASQPPPEKPEVPADTAAMIQAVGPNNAGYNPKLKDQHVALEAAEKSAMDKVEKIRAQKATLAKQASRKVDNKEEINSKGTAASSAAPTVVVVDEMNTTPGRKLRKSEMPAEDLEYCDRTEQSWSAVGEGSVPSPTQSP